MENALQKQAGPRVMLIAECIGCRNYNSILKQEPMSPWFINFCLRF
jgi:hypothetical protein